MNLKQVVDLATKLHENQVRKGSGEPYIKHPIAVMHLVEKYFLSPFSPEQQETSGMSGVDTEHNAYHFVVCAAALLHDTIEDCGINVGGLVGQLLYPGESTITPNMAAIVGELVCQLTSLDKVSAKPISNQNRTKRKELMRMRVPFMSLPAIAIKICDRLDNTKDLASLGDFGSQYARESIDLFTELQKALPNQYFTLHRAMTERLLELRDFIRETN